MSHWEHFHFKVVGDDFEGASALVSMFPQCSPSRPKGSYLEVDGIPTTITLSLYDDATAATVTANPPETVNGYIFVFNISDMESFERLKMWLKQIYDLATSEESMSVVQNSKILIGNVPKSDKRSVSIITAEDFASASGMVYYEICIEDDHSAVDQVISDVIRTKIPAVLPKTKTKPKNLFNWPPVKSLRPKSRSRSVLSSAEASPTRSISPNLSSYKGEGGFSVRIPRSRSGTLPIQRPTAVSPTMSPEFAKLTRTMMELNMAVTKFSNCDGANVTPSLPALQSSNHIDQCITVARRAIECIQSVQEKLNLASKDKNNQIATLRKQNEATMKELDNMTADLLGLQRKCITLEEEKSKLEKQLQETQERMEKLVESSRGSKEEWLSWAIDKEEVEISDQSLGTGGYATVCVAKFRGFEVAAKQLHGVILNSHNRKLFEREMNISASCRHPNLVQFLGAVIDTEPTILMELMPTCLRDVLPKEYDKLSHNQMLPICRDVARALTYLHSMRPEPIIHRDISSANVLLEPTSNSLWKAKVSDLGSANTVSSLSTRAPGNACYTAPEVLSSNLQSPKMDVYSFGVLVVEVYLREFPDPNNSHQMAYQVKLLHPKLSLIVDKTLQKDPQLRLDMADILQELSKTESI